MSTFDEVRTTRSGRWKGCPKCGAKKTAGTVGLALRQTGPKGTMEGATLVATKTRSFCEPCAVEMYQAAVALLMEPGS